ncbi:MAG: FGGY family carbohydrate kinase, partial [Bradymonadia bacterium]
MRRLIVSIDQGTTGTTVLVLDDALNVLGRANQEFTQHFPKAGWVEHEPQDILESVTRALGRAIEQAQATSEEIACVGITNQRETVVVWDRHTGKPVHRAIVWQDRRTAKLCETLKAANTEALVKQRTGLLLDPYFSGTKIKWILDETNTRPAAQTGDVICGTIDSFLVWHLTGGQTHVTDPSNACRTLLMNLETLEWDSDMLTLLDVPEKMLPSIKSSSEIYGRTKGFSGLPDGIPVSGMAGDQQAALFGQACFDTGEAKCTYGTGCFVLMNTGNQPVLSDHGLLTSVGWSINGEVTYVLEGSAFVAGAAVQWLRDGLGLIKSAPEIETLAESVEDSDGVYFVPALTGLGAPHWNPHARGQISGITRGTTAAHLARATLEGIAF